MKFAFVFAIVLAASLSHAAGGSDIGNSGNGTLNTAPGLEGKTAKKVAGLVRKSEIAGNSEITFQGGMNLSIYSVGNLTCYFQNADDSASCSAAEQLDEAASKTVGNLIRTASNAGDRSIAFEGGPNVTKYSIGNLECYFQNQDDSVSCGVGAQ